MVMERKRLEAELQRFGYSVELLKDWQHKVMLWRHKPLLNDHGVVCHEAGVQVGPLPGNPDSLNRYAWRGMLNWPPAESCQCLWCKKRDWTKSAAKVGEVWRENGTGVSTKIQYVPLEGVPGEKPDEKPEEKREQPVKGEKPLLHCDECDYVTTKDHRHPKAALRMHQRKHMTLAGYGVK